MINYDFDTVINRRGTASNKWDIPEDALGMVTADMDFRAAQPILDAMEERVRHGIFGYNNRTDSYFDAIIGWMQRRHQWEPQKDWICHALGVVPAIGYSILAFTKPGDKILLQPPVYHPFRNCILKSGRIPVTNPLCLKDGHYSMDLKDLEEKASDPAVKMMLLCNPQNPTGRVWTPDELRAVAEICLKHQVILFSDEIHCDFMLHGSSFYSMGRLSQESGGKYDSILLIGTSASKTFNLAGLQTASIIIPDDHLRSGYQGQLDMLHCGDIPTFGMIATEAAYRAGDEWLDQLLKYLEGNLDWFQDYVGTHIPGAHVYRNDSTYLAWMDCREWNMSDEALGRFFKEKAKIYLNLGSRFGEEGSGFVRLNLAVPRTLVEEAAHRIQTARAGL